MTSIAGVYAAGDVRTRSIRQHDASAGTGAMAAMDAEHGSASTGVSSFAHTVVL